MNRQYIGARYVPKFFGENNGVWLANREYEPLTIVQYMNNSYTSKKPVPASVGNPSENSEYWVCTGNYNAQVEAYREETNRITEKLNDIEPTVEKLDTTRAYVTPQMYGGKGDGVNDDTEAIKAMFGSGIKNCFFPSGTYIISDEFIFNEGGYRITGNDATIKNKDESNGGIGTFRFYASNKDIENVTIEGINFDANKANRTNAGNNGIFIHLTSNEHYTCRNFVIKNCSFKNNYGVAIYLDGLHDSNYKAIKYLYNVSIDSCFFYNVFQGVSQSSVFETYINNCHIEKTDSECITIDNNSVRSNVTNCTLISHNGGCGAIGTDDGRQCVIANNHFDLTDGQPSTNDSNGICFNGNTGTCEWYQITGNFFGGYKGGGIKIYGTEERAYIGCGNTTIVGNTFLYNTNDIWIGNCDYGLYLADNAYNSKVFVRFENKANILKQAIIDFPIILELANYKGNDVVLDDDVNANLAIVDGTNVEINLNFNYTGTREIGNVILNLPDGLLPNRTFAMHASIGCDNGGVSGLFIDRANKKITIGTDATAYINDGGYAYCTLNYTRSGFRPTS